MKHRYRIYYILMCIPLLLTILTLFFLPDKISEATYLTSASAKNTGSKYELLILPVFILGLCSFLGIILKSTERDSKKKNCRTPYIAGMGIVIFFNLLTIFVLADTILYANGRELLNIKKINHDLWLPLVCWGCTLLLFIIGLCMYFQKKPVGIYANAEAPDADRVADVKKYNHAVGRLFMGYSMLFVLSGFVSISSQTAGTAALVLSCMPGCIILMVIYECAIAPKYIL